MSLTYTHIQTHTVTHTHIRPHTHTSHTLQLASRAWKKLDDAQKQVYYNRV